MLTSGMIRERARLSRLRKSRQVLTILLRTGIQSVSEARRELIYMLRLQSLIQIHSHRLTDLQALRL